MKFTVEHSKTVYVVWENITNTTQKVIYVCDFRSTAIRLAKYIKNNKITNEIAIRLSNSKIWLYPWNTMPPTKIDQQEDKKQHQQNIIQAKLDAAGITQAEIDLMYKFDNNISIK